MKNRMIMVKFPKIVLIDRRRFLYFLGLSDNVMWNCLFRTGSSYVIIVNTELLSYFFEFKTVKKTEWKTLF